MVYKPVIFNEESREEGEDTEREEHFSFQEPNFGGREVQRQGSFVPAKPNNIFSSQLTKKENDLHNSDHSIDSGEVDDSCEVDHSQEPDDEAVRASDNRHNIGLALTDNIVVNTRQ